MPISCVLFDLDGTIIDSLDGIKRSFRYIADKHLPEKNFSDATILGNVGRPLEYLMREITDDDDFAQLLIKEYREHNRSIIPDLPMFPGTHETISSIRSSGLKTGLVTSKNKASTMLSLETHQLTDLMDVIITQDDVTDHKPDPAPLNAALNILDLSAESVAYVGDATFDILCAKAAGCPSIAALWGSFDRAAVLALNPDWALESIVDIPATILLPRQTKASLNGV